MGKYYPTIKCTFCKTKSPTHQFSHGSDGRKRCIDCHSEWLKNNSEGCEFGHKTQPYFENELKYATRDSFTAPTHEQLMEEINRIELSKVEKMTQKELSEQKNT